jgi:hypothetical protein
MMTFMGISLVKWIVIGAIYVIPGFIILRKIGYSGWWVITLFIPIIGLLMPWALALSRWPIELEVERARNHVMANGVLERRQKEREAAAQTGMQG